MKIKTLALLLAASIPLAACGQSIDQGEVGLYKTYGKIDDDVLGPGWQWVNPFSSDIITINTRALKWVGQKPTSTKDLQSADVTFAVTYQVDAAYAKHVYSHFGREWAARVMPQIVFNALGEEFGKWEAVQIISQRDQVARRVFGRIEPKLAKAHVRILSFDLLKVSYNKAFMASVEAKQIAIQDAIRQQNHTVEVREEAAQRVIQAEAEAKAIQLQTQALSANPAYVQLKAIEKWKGDVPQNMYGSAPIPFVGSAVGR